MFRSFFTTIFRGSSAVLCAVTIPPADMRSLSLYYYTVCGRFAATYCVIIQTQRTHISGRNSNGTKHSGGPPEDGREKRPEHVGVLYLKTLFFLTFCWF